MSAALSAYAPSPWDVSAADLAASSTPIFSTLFAEVDDETRDLVLSAVADEHVEPGPVVAAPIRALWEANLKALKDAAERAFSPDLRALIDTEVHRAEAIEEDAKPTPKRRKPGKPSSKKSPLADAEKNLRAAKGRIAAKLVDEFGDNA